MPRNNVPVFRLSDWEPVGSSRYEAAATPYDCEGLPPFEATCTNPDEGLGDWYWTLYRPNPHTGELEGIGKALAPTLADARRQVDHLARWWRDDPETAELQRRLADLGEYDTVTCDGCEATHNLGSLLHGGGTCDALLNDGTICAGTNFDGHPIDALAEVVVR